MFLGFYFPIYWQFIFIIIKIIIISRVLVDEKDQTFYMVMKVKNSKLRLLGT